MSDMHSTYKGWTIWRKNVHGMWSATKLGHLPLAADTLAGMRRIITDQGHLR